MSGYLWSNRLKESLSREVKVEKFLLLTVAVRLHSLSNATSPKYAPCFSSVTYVD
jgi:hypothetical protein